MGSVSADTPKKSKVEGLFHAGLEGQLPPASPYRAYQGQLLDAAAGLCCSRASTRCCGRRRASPGFNTSKGIEDLNRVGSYSGLMVQANLDQGPEGTRATSRRRRLGARIASQQLSSAA
ncbi:hypothetical protein [Casimicrobium huifangae]|uniref:hypothetical protein n=1 Tax=Casimicrobium huifangae TaxID=2591109 RepID=UPI0037844CF5